MGIGFLRRLDGARRNERNGQSSTHIILYACVNGDVPFQTWVSIPVRLVLAGVPAWWVNQMTVHHVHLDRVCRARECATRICTPALAGGVPMREGRSTRGESIAITRYMAQRSRWTGRNYEWVVGGRIRVTLGINALKGWLGGVRGRMVWRETIIRVCKSTSQGVNKRSSFKTLRLRLRLRVCHYPNDGKSGPVMMDGIKRDLIRLKHRTVLVV
jgi:hypothetical protein